MRDNDLMKDGDWMTKKEARRDNLPAHFTNEDIQKQLHEVGLRKGQADSDLPCGCVIGSAKPGSSGPPEEGGV